MTGHGRESKPDKLPMFNNSPALEDEANMDYETLKCEATEGIGLITLNRPEKRNALSRTLRDDIVSCLESLEQQPNVNAAIITGAGQAFCAGFDLAEFQTGDMQEIFAHATGYHHQVYNSAIPLVAAVNGQAVAGGMDLAMMCDLRIASSAAVFGQPQVKAGIAAAFDLLRTLIPEALARELCLTGRVMNANEALKVGLINEITEPPQLLNRACEVATQITGSKASKAMKQRFIQSQPDLFAAKDSN